MSVLSWRTPLADPPLSDPPGCLPPGKLPLHLAGYPPPPPTPAWHDHVMDGRGARPFRWRSVLVTFFMKWQNWKRLGVSCNKTWVTTEIGPVLSAWHRGRRRSNSLLAPWGHCEAGIKFPHQLSVTYMNWRFWGKKGKSENSRWNLTIKWKIFCRQPESCVVTELICVGTAILSQCLKISVA